MDYTHLDRIDLRVGRIALGTMNFGELTDQPTSFAIMDAAREAGINFFDTADVYGGPQSAGMAKGYGTPRRSSAPGWRRTLPGAIGSRWPPRSIGRWRRGQTTSICRSSTSAAPARPA